MAVNKWYPNPGEDQHNTNRQILDMLYKLQEQPQAKPEPSQAEATPETNGPSNTKINGLYVTASVPKAGDTIRFDAATGQFKFAP